MSRILLEDTFDFKPDRGKITESKDPASGLVSKRIPGTLSVCDCINGNRRKYPVTVWERNLSEGSILSQALARRSSFGMLEHPADGKVDLRSPISHITIEAKLVEREINSKKMKVVEGVIELLETPEGIKLASLINAGYDPLVSSRGYGSLIADSEGVDVVQDDFICEGWDVVSTPSFTQAQLLPKRMTASTKTTESVKKIPAVGEAYLGQTIIASRKIPATNSVEITLEDGSPVLMTMESAPAKLSAPAPSSGKANNHQTSQHMDIKAIRESIQSLKAIAPATLDARNFASGFQRMSELHNASAAHLSENASASWEVTQLHKEISAIEEAWVTAFDAPRAEVRKLTENQSKLLKVLKGVTAHSVKVRESLSVNLKKVTKATEVSEALAKRGRAWMEAARREVGSRKIVEKKYGVACEALDIMAGRYKGDVAELGTRVLELEFPTMTESHKNKLSEAKTPRDVVAARQVIEKDLKTVAPKIEAPAKVEEAKKDAPVVPAPAAPAKVEETKKPEHQIFRQDVAVVGVSESIGMVRRLSQGNATYHS